MVVRNAVFETLRPNYLFVEIAERRKAFATENPEAKIISLGVGDTTEPLPDIITNAFKKQATNLNQRETYTGYPEYNGQQITREALCEIFYKGTPVTPDEIFISDGCKPDLARLQYLFTSGSTVAVQDPVYPVYVDDTVLTGLAGDFDKKTRHYKNITYMPCNPKNDFFPDLKNLERTDIIYFCSPNNPTGAAATREQLSQLIQFAQRNKSLIIFDASYSGFITEPDVPRTIYELPGAPEVVFETNSFSKLVGFTGVRCGWTVCPKKLRYEDGTPLRNDWARIMATCFNGVSSLAEAGAIAALTPAGQIEMHKMIAYYKENARQILSVLKAAGFDCYGGVNGPYIWLKFHGKSSWELFDEILGKCHVVVTPGCGFGAGGEGFVRISSFAHREQVTEALKRIKQQFHTSEVETDTSSEHIL